jgi:6-pyruvoyltetrahydropterin/6-carboxytetrahydropterin synthase
MVITKEIHCHSGHCVTSQVDSKGNPGKCAQGLHGHSYRIIASVDGNVIQDDRPSGGMVIDFGDLKKAMEDTIYAEADHASYLWEKDPAVDAFIAFGNSPGKNPAKHHVVPFIPTAENLAKHWGELLALELAKYKILLHSLEVYETPTSSAIYATPTLLMEYDAMLRHAHQEIQ